MWKKLNTALIVLACLLVGLRIADRLSRRTAPLPELPKVNAYPALVELAKNLQTASGDLIELSTNQILGIASTNATNLEKARPLIRSETMVPIEMGASWSQAHDAEVASLKRMAVALALQARAEMVQGRTNESAETHLDLLLLGHVIGRGGVLADAIAGLTVETLGMGMLRGQVNAVDASTAKGIARQLEAAEARRELPERVMDTTRNWTHGSYGLVGRLGTRFRGEAEEKKFRERYNTSVSRVRRLMLLMAARAYELDRGAVPGSPKDLVPGLLSSVPLDRLSGKPFTTIPSLTAP